MRTRQSRQALGYDQYTVTVDVDPTFIALGFSTRKRISIASRTILSYFFEEQ